jgi:hypothetical protein
MAKLTDPDSLNFGTEIVVDTTGPKTIQLVATGNLSAASPGATSGVTGQAVYSKLVEGWESTLAYRRHSFAIKMYTPNEGEWINAWGPDDATTNELLRDVGMIETDGTWWMGLFTLGDFPSDTDQGYYVQSNDLNGTVVNFTYTGEINEMVEIKGTGGTPDNTSYLGVFYRTRPNYYDFYEVVSGLQLSALTAKRESIPLSSVVDPNIIESDANIDANTPYTGMTLDFLTGEYGLDGTAGGAETWAISQTYAAGDAIADSSGRYFRVTIGGTSAGNDSDLAGGSDTGVSYEVHPGERQIGTTYYLFSRIIDGNLGTLSECYQWGCRQERQTTDINDDINGDSFGAVKGQLCPHLFQDKGAGFDGTVLKLAEGVYLDDPAAAEKNNVVFFPHSLDGTYPNSNQGVSFPFKVNIQVLDVSAGNNLATGRLTLFFANDDAGDNLGNDFDTDNAIVMEDDTNTDIDIASFTSDEMNFTYDYDTNTQRGTGSDGTPVPGKAVAINAGSSEPIVVDFTLTRVDNVTIRISAQDDRNFSNP